MNKIKKIFERKGLRFSRVISFSKSDYLDKNPGHLIIFNARIYDLKTFESHKDKEILDFFEGQKLEIWYGDLDLTVDLFKLHEVALEIGTIVVTKESGSPVLTIFRK